ncbi:hypothetical protein ABFS82_04G084800 [Erythranthe guttata]|uniref:Clp R domain-containing protein n=1 Tax=Erythranthe guttata TaxID=4155 RepID=A0A022S279_ERYGU|nr:PREDICTED: uncharacterized protein LOC105958527 [Erythranthe guttata]EYU45978.1 hypothetical protein MIMGU_mgv1a000645mg [Erythranthe guttata]|eukprot:XP_012838016.1 PREDICTED: uncharacterized protein LOC105958527 [Erythranthe guttata]
MPTPVGVARQFLAEAAAAVLDDAVGVAKRRSHSQTTSTHIVSALLALPSSTLREACTRARSCAYSPRLQFRALELCVGVALDRVSVSKSAVDEPPISNSLMAAIKRSQANQRRHPETFHLYQQQLNSNPQNPPSISAVKVELKHFVMSILDDPIISRVFGDAGFRTQEIKLAIINPLTITRFSSTSYRPPPLFSCSVTDFEQNKRRHGFPFSEIAATADKPDDNSRRIGEIISKKNHRNPLLIGVYASDSYRNFADSLKRGETGALPNEIDRLNVVSIENEISECTDGNPSKEAMESKFKQVDEMADDCQGSGIILSCGDFKKFVDAESLDIVNNIVSNLKRLLIDRVGKLWLIGFLAGDDDYKKLLDRFPSIEMDLDLHLLPITSSSSPIGGKCFQSSLMRSFVPFGGFFSMPSELESQCTTTTKPSNFFCNSCNEKYEQEVSVIIKGGVSTDSVSDRQSVVNLPSWLQISECETSKRSHTVEAKEDKSVFDARVAALQRKWSDICKKLHSSSASQENIPSFMHLPLRKDTAVAGSLLNRSRTDDLNHCMSKQNIREHAVNAQNSSPFQQKMSSDLSLATDLTLGIGYGSAEECRRKPNLHEKAKTPSEVSHSSSSCLRNLEKQIYHSKELEPEWKLVAEKVYWQMEAIQTISRTLSRCKTGNRRDIWVGFMGPDKIGKRKIAASISEIVFGRKNESFLSLDLSHQGMIISPSNSVVDFYDSKYHKPKNGSGRKLIIDYLAEEISKNPNSVVLLENVDRADIVVQNSLSQAVKTGKITDARGRGINVNNTIFILASTLVQKGSSQDPPFGKGAACEFSEDKILQAKNFQMQIVLATVGDGIHHTNKNTANVSVSNKRKSIGDESSKADEASKRARNRISRSTVIDLNLPVEEDTDDDDDVVDDDDDVIDDGAWFEELHEHVDENVTFKSFEFDSLARKILKEIDVRLKKLAGGRVWLEIDREVMLQIVAAGFLADCEKAMGDWIEQVLCPSIDKAIQRCGVASDVVVKLVHCDGLAVETPATEVCLPARINVK